MTKNQRQTIIDTAIRRLKVKLGIKVRPDTDDLLANKLGIEPETLTEWKEKGNFDFILIKECIPEVNINWILSDWRYDSNGSYSSWSIDEFMQAADSLSKNRNIKVNITFEKSTK